jgi:DNA-binding transcriptional MerR regulator
MDDEVLQIGEVARRLDLSLNTIRHWDETGLAVPSARSPGGFRLYTGADVARMAFIKRFRPVGFGIEETREIIAARDRLAGSTDGDRAQAVARLERFLEDAGAKLAEMRANLADAEALVDEIRSEVAGQPRGRRKVPASVRSSGAPSGTEGAADRT